ncbi:MAG: AMP-binding protein, partial [Bacteroidia bacterium]|nr:AMP-binding protein [Bacteroidia bacterium]
MSKSYTCGISKEPLIGLTIGEKFDETVKRYHKNEALVVRHQNIRWTYAELSDQVNKCARALLSVNIKKGDRVGIWSSNRSEWTVIQFACAKVGAILVNINPSYRVNELNYALNQSGCVMIVIEDQFKYSNYHDMVMSLAPELSTDQIGNLKAEKLPNLKIVVSLSDNPPAGMLSWKLFLDRSEEIQPKELELRAETLCFDDPINIQYTSGTTGHPKGATLSHHNILNNSIFTAGRMNFSDKERVVIPVPLYHCFGMVLGNLSCMTHGATMIYPSPGYD